MEFNTLLATFFTIGIAYIGVKIAKITMFSTLTIKYNENTDKIIKEMEKSKKLQMISKNNRFDINSNTNHLGIGNHFSLYENHPINFELALTQNNKYELKATTFSWLNYTLDELCKEITELKTNIMYKDTVNFYRPIFIGDSPVEWILYCNKPKRSISKIFMPDKIKSELKLDVEWFMKSENWYKNKGIPRRRGYLLQGHTGSGKSSLITAICTELNLNIYWVQLTNPKLNDERIMAILNSVPKNQVILIEDIDEIITQNNLSELSPNNLSEFSHVIPEKYDIFNRNSLSISLQGLLNALDGPIAHTDHIIFFTSNHNLRLIRNFGPLLTRPGRIDKIIDVDCANSPEIIDVFMNFYYDNISLNIKEKNIEELAKKYASKITKKIAMCEIINHLMQNKDDPLDAINSAKNHFNKIEK